MKNLWFLILALSAALVGCGDDKGGGNSDQVNCGNSYGNYRNNYNGSPYNSGGNGRYERDNSGICWDRQSNRQVNNSLCSQNNFQSNNYNYGNNGYNSQYCRNRYGNYGNGNSFGNFGQYNYYAQSSPQCRHFDNPARPELYYIYQFYPGAGLQLCVEYRHSVTIYPGGQQAWYPYAGAGFHLYGTVRF